jgi:CubicO group peptidase (beta-lactamase class C family)
LKKTFYFLLLGAFFLNCNLSGNKKDSDDSLQYYPPTPAEIDKNEFRQHYRICSDFFDSSLLDKGFSGGLLVAKNGAVIFEKYQGFADLRKKVLMTDSTPLHIASTTKPFTAIAVLHLAGKNKLSLNDSITKFFPGFPYAGITVKMLLNHRSGLPNYLYFLSNSDWNKKVYATNQDVLDFLIISKPNKSYSPGTRFNYCNTNYVLLALIIEKITGKSFPEYMQQQFFGPINMKHTYVFTLKDTLTATPTYTYTGAYWNFDFLDATYGDKNIYTTPQDLLKWEQTLYTDQLISQSLLDSAYAGYSFEKPTIHNYGLGWRLLFFPNGKKVIYHFGKWHGSNAAFARLPDEKITIIILGNKFTRAIYNSAYESYNFFGDYRQQQVSIEEETDSLPVDKKVTPTIKKNRKVAPLPKPILKSKQ